MKSGGEMTPLLESVATPYVTPDDLPGRVAGGVAKQDHTSPAFVHTKPDEGVPTPVNTGADERATTPVNTEHDVYALGREYGEMEADDSLAHWRWAQRLRRAYEAGLAGTGDLLTEKEIGRRIGVALRQKAYRAQWVSNVLMAARLWPQPPHTEPERLDFMAHFYGNTGRCLGKLDKDLRRAARRFWAGMGACAISRLPAELRRAIEGVRSGCTALTTRRRTRHVPARRERPLDPILACGDLRDALRRWAAARTPAADVGAGEDSCGSGCEIGISHQPDPQPETPPELSMVLGMLSELVLELRMLRAPSEVHRV